MKIVFIYPRFEKFLSSTDGLDTGLVDYFLGNFTTPPSLGIPILASLTPSHHEIIFYDDNNGDEIDYTIDANLIAINCFTPQAQRAFEIADKFRENKKLVIIGGLFPSFMVDECLKHCDSVNVGEGELTWPQILIDTEKGQLKPVYKNTKPFDLSLLPLPKRELFYNKNSYDWDEDIVQLTRGCTYSCAMCSIPAHMGQKIRFRPIEQIVLEISQLKYENIYLADDILFFPQKRIVDFSEMLFKALLPLKKKFFINTSLTLNTENAFLDLIAKAGVKNFYCTMNVDPISIQALAGDKKSVQFVVDLVKKLEDREIRFFGSCGIGRDWDDESIGDKILHLYSKAQIHTAEFFCFTPYPGSVHWDRLLRQNRIFDKNWAHYNGAHVVFKPERMSEETLWKQFIYVWNEFYRMQKKEHTSHLEPATYKEGVLTVGKPLTRQGVKGQAVITGIGILSPIGNDIETVKSSLLQGKDGLTEITRFDASSFSCKHCGQISGITYEEHFDQSELERYTDPYLRYAIISARNALKDAKIDNSNSINRQIAIVVGTCNGGLLSAEDEYKWLNGKCDRPFDEKVNLNAQLFGFGKAIAHATNCGGDVWVVTTACSSTTGAIGLAQTLINNGYYSTVLVGGSDALSIANMSGFNGLKAVSSEKTAPFSLPIGLNIGESAVFWVMEDFEQAILRKVKCYGKVIGHATTCDAFHPTAPDPRGDGAFRTLKKALEYSSLSINEIGCINAHGTGTEANDRAETKGIHRLIGDLTIPVTSTKSFFGHCMGTAGILEATCNLLAMNESFIPPTCHFTTARPGCTLDYVPNTPRFTPYDTFISSNYAFGGNNAAIVITKWDKPIPAKNRKQNRVVITGASAITSLGDLHTTLLDALHEKKCGIHKIDRLKVSKTNSHYAGIINDTHRPDIEKRLNLKDLNLISKYAVIAAYDALEDGALKIRPKNAEETGIVLGISNASDESEHMNSLFSTPGYVPHLGSFSNITANSTTGNTAMLLNLKGLNMTLSPGPHAGLQSIAYSYLMLQEGKCDALLAGASDEIYPQYFANYDLMGLLHVNEHETNYKFLKDEPRKRVLGEGAGMLLLETFESAQNRNVPILGEILGYGMAMNLNQFDKPCISMDGIIHSIQSSLKNASLNATDIDLIVWAPQGNAQDLDTLNTINLVFKNRSSVIPILTTTFNTGFIEASSILITLASVLKSLQMKKELWPQCTGLSEIDSRSASTPIKNILCIGNSEIGYCHALICKAIY